MRGVKSLLALVLAICFLLSPLSGIARAADDVTDTVKIETDMYSPPSIEEEVGNITAETDGVYVVVFHDTDVTLTTGSITAGYSGVLSETGNEGAQFSLTVNGNIDAFNDGVDSYAYDKASVDITVNGNITAEDDDGFDLETESGSTAVGTVNGDISSGDDALVAGSYEEGSTTQVTVNGNLESGYWGVNAWAEKGGSTTVEVNGNIDAQREGLMVGAESYDGEDTTMDVTVNGNVTSSEAETAVSGEAYRSGAVLTLTITGDVTNASEEGYGLDLGAFSGGVLNTSITGNVTSPERGLWASSYREGSQNNIVIDGDVTGESIGLEMQNKDGGVIDVLVTGTVTGSEIPVVVGSDNLDGLSLTVWKIEPNEDGAVAGDMFGMVVDPSDFPDGMIPIDYVPEPVDTEDFEKKIKYIVKLEQPEEGATISATDAEGNALGTSHEYEVANEGDKVLLKVDLQKGYLLKAAFNGDGEKVDLLQDEAGNYYVVVPKGGGVYLSVELGLEEYELTFDLDGAELDGQTGTYTMKGEFGSTINLPGPPKKDGFEFDYWEGSVYYAGDPYKIDGPHAFKAIWKTPVTPEPTPTPTPTPDTTPTPAVPTRVVPNTGDTNSALWAILLMFSAMSLTAFVAKRKEK